MSRPFFSIVIPTYDRARTIGRAIDSCLIQTFQDYEIVIVDDDKSSDDMEAAVAPYRDNCEINLILDHKGKAAAARNTGVRMAKGQYIAFLDADDAWLPDKLELCHQHLLAEPDTLFYSQNYVDRGVGKYWIKPGRGLKDGEEIYEYLFLHKGWVHPTSIVVDADTARKCPFREDLSFGDDTQLAVDFWRNGTPIKMIDKPLTIYHDPYEVGRLSQTPAFERKNTVEHTSFIDWVESHREHMSESAWVGYRAFFYSRFIAGASPLKSLKEIWRASLTGTASPKSCLAQTLQTFAPGLYRRLTDQWVRIKGLKSMEQGNQDAAEQVNSAVQSSNA